MKPRDNYPLIVLLYLAMAFAACDWWAAAAEGQEWIAVPPIRQSGLPGLLGELEDRMPAQHIYRDNDRITWAHETTHGLNSRIRNQHGSGVNAVYLYGCGAVVLKEPPVTIAQVAAAVKDRGRLFDLYLVKQRQDWNNQPLYIVDEMVSCLNGAIVGHEWGECDVVYEHENAVEMYKYAVVLYELVAASHPEYDRQGFRALLDRTHEYLEVLLPYGVEAKSKNVACVTSNQSGGLFGRAGFHRRMPTFPCQGRVVVSTVPAGLPPRRPDPPGSPPVLPGPGPPDEPPLDPPLVPIVPPAVPGSPESVPISSYEVMKLLETAIGNSLNKAQDERNTINKRLDELQAAIEVLVAEPKCEVTLKVFDSLTQSVEALASHKHPEPKAIDLDALAEKVLARLPPITFQSVDGNGKPVGEPRKKHLGETLKLHSYLVEKPE